MVIRSTDWLNREKNAENAKDYLHVFFRGPGEGFLYPEYHFG